MGFKIKTLGDTSLEKIADALNLSFSDYFVPFVLTPEQLLAKMKADKTNLDYSVGVFEGENLIALILHGTDIIDGKKVVYNGGTGVIPEKRGQGLTKKMYEYILPVLKKEEVDYLVLEVISINIQAIKSYEKTGYKISRVLKCYKGQIDLKNEITETDSIEIKKLNDYDWKLMQSFWDIQPTWQNSKNVLEEIKETNLSLGAYINNKLIGYVIYNPVSKRIQQIAVHKDFRRLKVASRLLLFIAEQFGNEMAIINVEESSEPINSFLVNTGFENYLNQLEMKLELR